MSIAGSMLIGSREVHGADGDVRAMNPTTGEPMEPPFGGGTLKDVNQACALADAAFDAYRATSAEVKAQFLERIAQEILDIGDLLIERAGSESGLPRARLEGERGRTCGQLRLFASLLRDGRSSNLVVDTALPERTPLPRPDLRSRKIPIGPVAVFGASNFPLAFSVGGGDTASALAAGCPVIAKSHPSHLGTSELVGRAIRNAVAACGLSEGVFSLLHGNGNLVGGALVQHPAIQGVAFTGSRRGGLALVQLAQHRPQPIPVFAEMSSTNPCFLLPAALASRAESIATGFANSVSLGVGQFCTKPGLVIGIDGPDLESFIAAASKAVAQINPGIMLNPGIHSAYVSGKTALSDHAAVVTVAEGKEVAATGCSAQAALFETTAKAFLATPVLAEEVFGPTSLCIRCADAAEMAAVANSLEGQLTATLQMDDQDLALAESLLPVLERKAGRILVNGFPTGVEVSYAMVHGGPYPSTSDSRVTSVGAMAIERFLRPVCYQGFPQGLLPPDLQEATIQSRWRLVDGTLHTPKDN
jgi:alpha-ketoglutaric semialdehyde dehydrogenase